MTKDDIIKLAREAEFTGYDAQSERLHAFADLVAKCERDALEAELLKLKKGIGASSMYIQGRWDLIGEFQDIIRARGNRT